MEVCRLGYVVHADTIGRLVVFLRADTGVQWKNEKVQEAIELS